MKRIFYVLSLGFVGIFSSACWQFIESFHINNVWKIPDTKLELSVRIGREDTFGKTILRTVSLREGIKYERRLPLAKGAEEYARLNVYQASETQYVLRDVYKTYLLDTTEKSLKDTNNSEYNKNQKFIGAFDYNENGGWRYIPESERKEIPLTSMSEK